MKKTTKIILSITALVLALALGVGLGYLLGRHGQGSGPASNADATATYTVEIQSSIGTPMEGVGVYIYTDDTCQEMVWFAKTDSNGRMSFTDRARDTYVAVLKDVPTGYKAEESYPLTGELTQIILATGELTEEDLLNVKYELGDMMLDFTVVDTDGVEHTLSELLKVKKAVVLNFWYAECEPCKSEFPYLQEAYEQYSDQIEVLALNPVNQDEGHIAAFKKDMGLTFPVAKVDAAWEQMMQLTAYPTTMVIDRFGNICLIHGGTIPDTKTFADTFAYFVSDQYEPKLITDINELVIEEEQGTETNPLEFGGVTSFEVTVDPGQTVHVNLYKVKDRYMQVKNADCSIVYNDKTYKPSNGTIGFMVSAPDNFTPAKLQFTNNGKEKQTFKVTLSALKGSRDNPYALELGEFNASVNAGNDQGVYYRYTAPEDGTLKLKCLQSSVAKYGYSLYNLNSYAMRNLETDVQTDETTGERYVSVAAKKGQVIEVCISTLPDSTNSYPAGSFKFLAEFNAGDVEDDEKAEKLVYTVTVTDDQEQPMPNVTVWFTKDTETQSIATDENGAASLELEKGTYTVMLTVPEGYELETNSFELTEELTEITIVLAPAVDNRVEYKVTVTDVYGDPVPGTTVVIGTAMLQTDEDGIVTVKLEPAFYTALITAPEGYVADPAIYNFAEGVTEITVELSFVPGTENNPLWITNLEEPVQAPVGAEASVFYTGNLHDTVLTIMDAPNVFVRLDGVTYGSDEHGVLTVSMPAAPMGRPMPVVFELGNLGTEDAQYTLYFRYPVGHAMNPKVLEDISSFTTTLPEGDSDGFYYSWTATEDGTLTLQIAEQDVAQKSNVIVTNQTSNIQKTLWEYDEQTETDVLINPITLDVTTADQVQIIVSAMPDEFFIYPAHEVTVSGTVEQAQTPSEPDETQPEETQPDVSEPEETQPEETQPEETQPQQPANTTYSVTVVDGSGAPITSGVTIMFMNEGGMVDFRQINNASGIATVTLATGNYTVSLAFADTSYHYDSTAAVLSPEKPAITLSAAKGLSADATVTDKSISGIDTKFLDVPMGATYVQVNSSQTNYAVINGKSYCFFRLLIDEAGVYSVDASGQHAASDWGTNPFYIYNQTSDEELAAGCFEITLKDGNFSSADDVKEQFIGVEVVDGQSGTILTITRLGDVTLGVVDAPWIEYKSSAAPKLTYDEESGTYSPTKSQIYKLTMASGQSLKYVNLSTDTAVKGTDGYYHLNSADGPILYVNLGANAPYISMYNMFGLTGFGGTSFRKIFYNPDGTPMMNGDAYVKEDYTAAMLAYTYHADTTHGVYPLNEDIVYMLQNGGEYAGWYTPGSGSYLFEETQTEVDDSLGWMFAVCYVE